MNDVSYDKIINFDNTILTIYPSGAVSYDNSLSTRVYLDMPDNNPGIFGSSIVART